MARRYSIPSSPSVYTREYKNFKGVDFGREDVACDNSHFPYAQNLIIGKDGVVEKRPGFRKLAGGLGEIHSMKEAEFNNVRVLILHIGTKLYRYENNSLSEIRTKVDDTEKSFEIADKESCMCFMSNKLFVLADGYYCYDGEYIYEVANMKEAYIPTVEILRKNYAVTYEGSDYDIDEFIELEINNEISDTPGMAFEEINLFSKMRTVSFAFRRWIVEEGDMKGYGTPSRYYSSLGPMLRVKLPTSFKRIVNITMRCVKETEDSTWSNIKIAEGEYEERTLGRSYYDKEYYLWNDTQKDNEERSKCLENPDEGWFTIICYENLKSKRGAYLRNELYDYSGAVENVFVTYEIDDETYKKSCEKINGCTIATKYGVSGDDRIFLSGNNTEINGEKYCNYIWYSDFNNPFYFTDLNYIVCGTNESEIIGFSRLNNNYLSVHKKGCKEANIFLVSGELNSEGVLFRVTQGIPSVAAVSKKGFATVGDEPTFASEDGIYGVVSTNIISEKSVANRSGYINNKYRQEKNKEALCMVKYKDMLVVGVNSNVYILRLDTKVYSQHSNYTNTFEYECLYFSNIPAKEFIVFEDELYFASFDGFLCKFNTDIDGVNKYNDAGEPIDAFFLTKADDDGSFMVLKTMIKRGCGVMLKPYDLSSVKIYAICDKNESEKLLKIGRGDKLNFEYIDFSKFNFSTKDSAYIIPFNSKIKKYTTLQFKVQNDEINEGFGVFGIEKRYITGNYKKY